jgi:outer membrane immunogenic protein
MTDGDVILRFLFIVADLQQRAGRKWAILGVAQGATLVKSRLLRGAALPLLIATPAMAADLPVKAPPAPPPPAATLPNWTGVYVGLDAGYAWGKDDPSCAFVPGVGSPCQGIAFPDLKSQGGLFGAEIGANWQYQNWVLGVAADWSALDVHSSAAFPSVDAGKTDQLAGRYDWLGTARGRVGYAFGQSLLYGTGGFAAGQVKYAYNNEFNSTSAGYFTTTGTRDGWTAGAGWEYRITPNWGFKLEYLHVNLGSSTLDISASKTDGNLVLGNLPGTSVLHFNNSFDLVRAGVNYKW